MVYGMGAGGSSIWGLAGGAEGSELSIARGRRGRHTDLRVSCCHLCPGFGTGTAAVAAVPALFRAENNQKVCFIGLFGISIRNTNSVLKKVCFLNVKLF